MGGHKTTTASLFSIVLNDGASNTRYSESGTHACKYPPLGQHAAIAFVCGSNNLLLHLLLLLFLINGFVSTAGGTHQLVRPTASHTQRTRIPFALAHLISFVNGRRIESIHKPIGGIFKSICLIIFVVVNTIACVHRHKLVYSKPHIFYSSRRTVSFRLKHMKIFGM